MACLAIGAVPFLATSTLVHVALERSLVHFSPYLNDEVAYWHQVATFRHAGFGGGYYSAEEHPGPTSSIRFGLHGPGYPVLYGSLARLTGWYRDTAPRFNAALVGAALVGFAAIAQAPLTRLLLLATVVMTFWPVPYWTASNMQEPLHYAAALIVGALIARRLTAGDAMPRALVAGAWLLIAALIVVRPSWALAVPLWVLAAPWRSFGVFGWRLAGGVAVALVLTGLFFRIAAPIPDSPISATGLTLAGGIEPLISRLAANLARLGQFDDFEAIELWHRGVYGLALFASLATLVAAGVLHRRRADLGVRHAAIHVVNLWGIVAAMFAMYAVSNMTEFRIIAAHIVLSASVLAGVFSPAARGVLLVLLVANMAAAPIFWEDFRQTRATNFRRDLRSLRQLEEVVAGRMVYVPGADPWCNTFLTAQYPPDLIAIPPGIGLSVLQDPERMDDAIKSRYVLLDTRTRAEFEPTRRLERIGDLPYGTVYVNRSVACPGGGL